MRDLDVRLAVRRHLSKLHEGDPDTRVVEEMGIWAHSVRIDIAVINGEFCGFELKSARDNLERLPLQADIYSRVFDRISLVVADRHAEKAMALIPDWWGVSVARSADTEIDLSDIREAKLNPSLCALHVARMLWKPEALALLEKFGESRGYKSKSTDAISRRVASVVPLDCLRNELRSALKTRTPLSGQPIRH